MTITVWKPKPARAQSGFRDDALGWPPGESPCALCPGQVIDTGQAHWGQATSIRRRIHVAKCPNTCVLSYTDGFRLSHWITSATQCCPYQCAGVALAHGVTHSYDCPWWADDGGTPF